MTTSTALTDLQIAKILQAKDETQQMLNKELSYSVHLQKTNKVVFYRAHIATLSGMLLANARATWLTAVME